MLLFRIYTLEMLRHIDATMLDLCCHRSPTRDC